MLLEVQKFFRNGGTVESLGEELGIRAHEKGDLVLLTYHQIDSPKSHPIVMECRGIVLEKGTWDVVSLPFRRFFNYGEMSEITGSVDFSKVFLTEKLDGSIISLFNYKGRWVVCTRGRIDADGEVLLAGITFEEMFKSTADNYPNFWGELREELAYYFELIGPENRVVTRYVERELYLLTVRSRCSWAEVGRVSLESVGASLGVKVPKLISIFDRENVQRWVSNASETLDEGFVAVDYSSREVDGISWPRVKIKNPSYVAIAHMKDSAGSSLRSIVQLVMKGEEEEFLSYFPEYEKYVRPVVEAYAKFLEEVNASWEENKEDFVGRDHRDRGVKKEFALRVGKQKGSSILFALFDGQVDSVAGYFELQIEKKGEKNLAKSMLSVLGVKDMDLSEGE